ncbi:MAG: hypothetical protein JWP44_4518 [Mucilaginibacter sp.]|nr:hypothetical protein [Mucilaginibacter sp.]
MRDDEIECMREFHDRESGASEARYYARHVAREGNGSTNEHPEGCYWCGSYNHLSNDCMTPIGAQA